MSDEAILEELKKLREEVAAGRKPAEPTVIKPSPGGLVTNVDLRDIAEGRVQVDLPQPKPAVKVDMSRTLTEIAAEGCVEGK